MSKLKRTIVLLTNRPTDLQAEGFAAKAAMRHWESVSFNFGVSANLPSDLDERTMQHLSELKRDAGPEAVYLIVHNKE